MFEDEAKKIGGAEFLAQGTLYPDVIESVSFTGGPSVTIKSHHNVGGLPERMDMKLVEPLRELFKDEVRALGRELGLPEVVRRAPSVPRPRPRDPHPRRGHQGALRHPAQGGRDLPRGDPQRPGCTTRSGRRSRCCCRSAAVGVMGDGRTYDNVLALRAVTSTDGMTAQAFQFPGDFLPRVATRIINEVAGHQPRDVRLYSKPPGTIEWE